ncbi:hypothetical protein NO995_07490 [Aestuariibaculum sp. M13]|uniref:RHS repeat domain-containing protein n=1 Tax=Aestuariibaculum sp. M13 TaxID=2967132 RepID=UPI002159E136|nr:RHS repeat protein [Aestuariibaculum sp. M13]MCR8667518.1 hypothetical protein [Aestuariibaculum sp. M13]
MYSQEDYYGKQLNSNVMLSSQTLISPSVSSPDITAFTKYNFVPTSNYTGRANINIPFYEISSGNIHIPINISYNSSGAKVSDMASNVGLNWSLNAGGAITRIIKGVDDFTRPKYTVSTEKMGVSGWLGYTSVISNFSDASQLYNDPAPDVFVVNAPGLSTKYIHEKHLKATNGETTFFPVSGTKPDPIELNHQGNLIDETFGFVTKTYFDESQQNYKENTTFGLQNVKVTALNGLEYSFSTPDLSRHQSGYGELGLNTVTDKISAYKLDRIYDPSTNQEVIFEYEQYYNYFEEIILTKPNSYGGGTDIQYSHDTSKTVFPYLHRLKNIYFEGGVVQFIYGLNRLDNTGEKALTEIKVKDQNNIVVKHFKLSYGYFQSNIGAGTAQSKRLRLDRVYEVDKNANELPGYSFNYDTLNEMPPRNSYAHDFLGYNNGSFNQSIVDPVPIYYFKNNKVIPFNESNSVLLPGNFSLEANEAYCKSYSLTQMTLPTGGRNEYEYEINKFQYLGSTKEGGGLRLKSQKIIDEEGSEQIIDYEYGSGGIARFPNYAAFKLKNGNWNASSNPQNLTELTSYFGIDTFTSPQSYVEYTNGSFVGYQNVTVKNRLGNGKTTYNYKGFQGYPNLDSSKSYNISDPYSESWSLVGKSSLYFDRDFMRGILESVLIYDESGGVLKAKYYTYSYNEFRSISLSHLNKAVSGSSNCYSSNGEYYWVSSCGGYVENLELPIARYLLSSVIEYDNLNSQNPNSFVTKTEYTYDFKYPLIKIERKSVGEDDTLQGLDPFLELYTNTNYDFQQIKEISYPLTGGNPEYNEQDEISGVVNADNLVAQNRLSTVLNVKYKDRNSEIIREERYNYKNFGNDIIDLENIEYIGHDGTASFSEQVSKRDSKGNILEVVGKTGNPIVFVWGYNKEHLIARIENATIEQGKLNSINATIQTYIDDAVVASDEDNSGVAENTLRSKLQLVRSNLPLAMVTTYTYDPLVGVTSETDPRGNTISYVYDDFGRLEYVKDADSNILSKNEYHYQGQQ